MEPDTITVRLLGGFSIRFGDNVLDSLPPQAVSLLSYLIVHRDRPQTRDLLAGRFWSELAEDRARKRLSNSLWQIKAATSEANLPDLLVTSPTTVQFTSKYAVSVDFEEFEAQLSYLEGELRTRQLQGVLADRLASLVNDYPGDFLSGHYQDWIELERDRIRDRYNGALVQLIQLYKSRSEYDVALRFAVALVKQDPLREDLQREVIRLHALLGQTPAAERQFQLCRQVLKAELGVEPSAETVELIERIRTDAPSPVLHQLPGDAKSAALIGRSQELSVLLGRAEELLGGNGGVVLVEGEPGIGKTRLIDEFTEGADWRGIRILSAGHTELSRMRPYETLREALAPAVTGLRGEHLVEVVEPVWLQQAAEVVPEIRRLVDGEDARMPLHPEEEPTRTSEALARVILAQGGLGPTLIVLEDIHWCDNDSMQVLVQLGSRLARSGVLLCLTYRRFEAEQSHLVWSGISKLEALPSGSRLIVGPLNGSEVRELIAAQLGPGGLPGATMSQLVGQTNGNPLYILESVRNPGSLLNDGDLDQPLRLGALDLPSSVVKSLEQRVGALQPAELATVQALAALAEPASAQLVSAIANLDRRATLEALTSVATQGFVVDDEQGVCRFAHDQTRRVVYELMTPAAQALVHERIYLALDDRADKRAEQLAYHARLAGRMADAHHWHLVAAREAWAVNGYRTAADHYGQADEAAQDLGMDMADRAKDLLVYESALDILGRRSEQTMLLKRLRGVELPLPLELELAEREVWLLLNTDEPDEGARLALDYVQRAKNAGEDFVGLLTTVAVARYRAGDFRGAIAPAQEALEAALEPAAQIAAQTILGKALVDLLNYEEGEQYLSTAAALADSAGDLRGKIEALNYQAVAQARLGRYADAEEIFAIALELSRSIGYRLGEGQNLVNMASVNTVRGQGGRALDYLVAATEVFGSLDQGRGEAYVKTNLAELNHRLLGDDESAASLASSAAVYFRSVGDQPHECIAMCVLSSVDRRRGKRRLARRRLNELVGRATAQGDTNGEVEGRRVLAKLEMDSGDWRAAIVHLDQILRLGEEFPLDTVLPNVLAQRAYAALMVENQDRARAFTERSLAVNMAGTEDAHVTAWACGQVLRDLGDDARATEQFKLAYELLSAGLQGLPPDVVDRSWTSVPEHVQIAADFERRFTSTLMAQIPARDAPMGRSLNSDEYVDVVWTIADPKDWEIEQPGERRRHRLYRLTSEAEAQGGSARIADLAKALAVSERTIKRDIADLRADGTILKTRKSR